MKVVVSDLFSDSTVEALREAGLECHYDHTLKGQELKQLLQEEQPQILLVRSTRLTADTLSTAGSLELIVRAGTGTDGIDLGEASRKGILVAHCPGMSAMAVAELVFGLICAADRSIPENVGGLREGVWNKGRQAAGLYGKTIGILGLGDIGVQVAIRAKAFGMTTLGYDPRLSKAQTEELGLKYRDGLLALIKESDVLTFHVPNTKETRHMLTAELLEACKENALIVNTSRWDVVSEEELLAALEAKPGLRYACDCHRLEPGEYVSEYHSRLTSHPRVYGTCHIGSFTKQADEAFDAEAAALILHYARTRKVLARNCTNRVRSSPATHSLEVRVMNTPGILASVVNHMAISNWQVLEIESVLFQEAQACRASLDFLPADLAEVPTVLEQISRLPGVMGADCFLKPAETEEKSDS